MIPEIFKIPLFWIGIYIVAYCIVIIVYSSSRLRGVLFFPSKFDDFIRRTTGIATALLFLIPPIFIVFSRQPILPLTKNISVPLGFLFLFIGAIIEILARKEIGIIPGLRKKGKLIKTGIYNVIRHPIYLGNSLLAIGASILFRAQFALFFSLIYLFSYLPIIILEERLLIKEYGEVYKSYKQNTPNKLIPRVI